MPERLLRGLDDSRLRLTGSLDLEGGQRWFGGLADLVEARTALEVGGITDVAEEARLREILAASEAFGDACRNAEQDAGVTDAAAAHDRTLAVLRQVREDIIRARSSHPDLLVLKVRATIDACGGADPTDEVDEAITSEGPWEIAMALSLVRDLRSTLGLQPTLRSGRHDAVAA